MQQVVTFTGFSTKTGSNDSGGWTLYLFETAGGTKFQTFDDDLGAEAAKFINQAADVDFETEERTLPPKDGRPAKTVTNYVLKSVRAATGTPPNAALSSGAPPNAVYVSTTSSQDEWRRTKEEMRRTESVKAAATILASPNWEGELNIEALGLLTEKIAGLIETGTVAEEAVRF